MYFITLTLKRWSSSCQLFTHFTYYDKYIPKTSLLHLVHNVAVRLWSQSVSKSNNNNNNFLLFQTWQTHISIGYNQRYRLYEIRPIGPTRRLATWYIGSRTTIQENQPAAQIAARHNIFFQNQMEPYMSWIFLVLAGIYPGFTSLGGEI